MEDDAEGAVRLAAVFEPSPYNVAFVHPLLRRFVAAGIHALSFITFHRLDQYMIL